MNLVSRYAGCLAFVLTLVGYPVVAAVSSFAGIENRPLAIGFRGTVLALALAASIFNFAKLSEKGNKVFWFAWICFWVNYVICILADTSGAMVRLSLEERLVFCIGMTMVPSMAVLFVEFGADRESERLVSLLSIAIGSIALFANLIYITRFGGIRPLEGFNFRAESNTLNPISIGHLSVTILIFLFLADY